MSGELKLASVVDDLVFLPKSEQRQVKSAFWAVVADNPIHDPETITLEDMMKVTGDTRLRRWIKEPGFREWFLNKEEFRQRLEYLAHLTLDRLEKILSDDEGHASAQVQAAKLIIEAANRMPQKWVKETYLDDRIQKMGKAELEQFIRRNMALLPETAAAAADTKKVEE
jgi:hypothetical protein